MRSLEGRIEWRESPELPPQHTNVYLVFGQGPVVDRNTRLKAADAKTALGE